MAKFILGHFSALEFYRNARCARDLAFDDLAADDYIGAQLLHNPQPQMVLRAARICPEKKLSAKDFLKQYTYVPHVDDSASKIDLLVGAKTALHNCKKLKLHVISGDCVRGMFLKIKDQLYVCSPEFLLCLLARTLNYVELFLLVLEFCGNYCIAGDEVFYGVPKITSKLKLQNFVNDFSKTHGHFRGVSKLQEVIKFAENDAASPQEAKLFIKLCAPRKMGGYALKNIKMNKKIALSAEAQQILGYAAIRPDLCNEKTKLAIEYDSEQFHDNAGQNTTDKLRLDALRHDA